MSQQKIRPIAIGIIRNGSRILVNASYDPRMQQRFYRPLGGGIEFGEHSSATLVREFQEELGVALCDLRYLGTLENIFVYNGQGGHELVVVYAARFVNEQLYAQPTLPGQEDNGAPFTAEWLDLTTLQAETPLYPNGLLALLTATGG